jgi:hypothetical protein
VTYCPAPLVRAAPLRMTVSAGGAALGTALLDRGDARFDLSFALPGKLAGKGEFEVAIEVDRTFIRPKTGRESGAAFGTFEVR